MDATLKDNAQAFQYWITERERIRLAREAGRQAPWTADPILGSYRFCNVRRRDDRVSKWIINKILEPYALHPNLWAMAALARYVNWPDTLAELMAEGLWPDSPRPDWRGIGEAIDARKARGEQTWTGAYMIRAESNRDAPWYKWGKGRYVAEVVVGSAWANRKEIAAALLVGTVEAAHTAIAKGYGWGSFMAGQVVADLTYTPVLRNAPDLYTWAPLGPGSKRGLNRVAGRPVDASLTQWRAVREMRALYRDVVLDLGIYDLTLHDVQNVACETDKYLRVQNGEGKPRSRYAPCEAVA